MNEPKRRKGSIDLSTMVYGRVPPQAKELEEVVLGACMLDKSAIDILIDINFKAECFYVESHQIIFQAMMEMQQRSYPIDELTLVEELKKKEQLDVVGGAFYILQLTNKVVSTANLETHARIVIQKFIQRELINISGEIIGQAYEDGTDVFDLLDDSESKIFAVANIISQQNYYHASQVQAKTLNGLDKRRLNDSHLSGITSGFKSLDRITHGWQDTDLIILAARPSVGKSALAINFARNAANTGTGVGFFSLEMSSGQIIERIWSAESEIFMDKIKTGQMEDYEYSQLMRTGVKKVESMPLWIDDTPALNIFQFRSKARKMVTKNKVKLIIIDYLQLMKGMDGMKLKSSNREQEISNISRNLKALAKELSVPIIALSQMSRNVESRQDKTPQLSDLRESGAIEQDADMVAFIYRPEYYGKNEIGESSTGETHIKIAKHRNGSLDTIYLKAILHYQKFEEWQGEIQQWKPVSKEAF
jgi:replicative DNA helicase